MDESVFHSYECANQTRLPTKLKREINKNRDRFNMAAYGRKPLCHFLHLDLRFRDRMSDPFEKKSTDSQHGFLFVDFFSFTCVYYDTRYGQKTKHGALWERARVPLFLVGTVFTQQTTLICYFFNCRSVEVHLLVNRLISVFCNISLTQEAHVRRIDVFFVWYTYNIRSKAWCADWENGGDLSRLSTVYTWYTWYL